MYIIGKALIAFIAIFSVTAQVKTSAQVRTQCGIYFDYDVMGNRIKRYYDCQQIIVGPGPSGQKHGSDLAKTSNNDSQNAEPKISPNPTAGVFYLTLPDLTSPAHFHLYDQAGRLITGGDFIGQYNGDIRNLASASYIIRVKWKGKDYTYKLIRI